MIYANGLGTAPDPALALRMGCESAGYPNNLTSSDLDYLQTILQAPGPSRRAYDICAPDSPAQHQGNSLCSSLAFELNRKRVYAAAFALFAKEPPATRALLGPLEQASVRFHTSTLLWEDSVLAKSGPNGVDGYQSQEQELDNTLLTQLQTIKSGKLPEGPAANPGDAALNQSYNELLDRLRGLFVLDPPLPNVLLNPLQEQGTERDWIVYRDAWTALVEAQLRASVAQRWRDRLTAERTAKLQQISSSLPPVPQEAKGWIATCARARQTPLPPDITAEPVQPSHPVCDSYRPLYGIGTAVDLHAARQCAIAERNLIRFSRNINIEYPKDETAAIGESINGSMVLAMFYASGQGVERNPGLAQRFVCEAIDAGQIASSDESSPQEPDPDLYSRLLREIPSGKSDLCDYVAPLGRAETVCDRIGKVLGQQDRSRALEEISRGFTPDQKTAYTRLLNAFETYLAAHDQNEITVMGHYLFSGAWDGTRMPSEQAFLENIRQFEQGKHPKASADQYPQDDRLLNQAFRKVVSAAPAGDEHAQHSTGDEPTQSSIRQTERLWLAYRDAFADFGTQRYPGTTRPAWLAYVTEQRTRDLNDPCFMDATCGK